MAFDSGGAAGHPLFKDYMEHIEQELIDELIKSHDELMRVSQACFQTILKAKLMHKLDKNMFALKVEGGFAGRAEEAARKINWAKRRMLAVEDSKPS